MSIVTQTLFLLVAFCGLLEVSVAPAVCANPQTIEEAMLCSLQAQQKELLELKSTVVDLKTQLFLRPGGSCYINVAFRAQLSHTIYKSTAMVPFDIIRNNDGNGYTCDGSVGFFTAPCKGHYSFSIATSARDGYDTNVFIFKQNSTDLTTEKIAYTFAIGQGHWAHASTSVVATLDVHDRVWVSTEDHMEGSAADAAHMYSVFSGGLLQAD